MSLISRDFPQNNPRLFTCWLNGVIENFPDQLFSPVNSTWAAPPPQSLPRPLSLTLWPCLGQVFFLTYGASLQPGGDPEFSNTEIAEPTQSRWLQRSEGQFWRGGYLLCTFRQFNALSAVCPGREHHSGRTKKQCTQPQQNICPRHPNKRWSHLSTSHSGRHTEAQWSRSLSCYKKKHPQRFISLLEAFIYLFSYFTAALIQNCCIIIKRQGEECCKPCTIQIGKNKWIVYDWFQQNAACSILQWQLLRFTKYLIHAFLTIGGKWQDHSD